MAVEVGFGIRHLLRIEQQEMPPSAVGQAIDERTPQPACQIVIDQRTDVGTEGSKTTTSTMLSCPSPVEANHAAGGTTTSEGKGMNELSMAMKSVMTQ